MATSRYDDATLRALRGASADAEALAGVLSDPIIGDFEVRTVLDQPSHAVAEAVEEFFADRSTEDLLICHFSGHGIKNQDGELHFAATNTRLTRLGSTAVAAQFVNRQMTASRSRRIVLLLDCCYAGAFDRGMSVRAGGDLDIKERFAGRGRAVLTATGAVEYAFEGNQLAEDQSAQPSMFTSAMVRGLSTGEADRDQDGWVGLDELYDYIYEAVRGATPNQTPGKWTFGLQGDLHLARRGRPVTVPPALPAEVQQSLESPLVGVRTGAVQELARLAKGHHQGLALGARLALTRLGDDDSRAVAAAAADAMAEIDREADDGQRPDESTAGTDGPSVSRTTSAAQPATGPLTGSTAWFRGDDRRRRRVLVGLVAGIVIVVAGGLLAWHPWREDKVVTIPADFAGEWSADQVHIQDTDRSLTLRLRAGARSGQQDVAPDACRYDGTYSEIGGTRSHLTMTFQPNNTTDPDCVLGEGRLTLTPQGNNSLLAEFRADPEGEFRWDAKLQRQGD